MGDEPEIRTSVAEPPKRMKSFDGVDDIDAGDDIYSQANPSRPGFTKYDQKDMYRMGKTQEFQRNYRPLSALSFSIVLSAFWEYLLIANTQGLTNGGLAGVFWSNIATFVGFGFVILSLAEMASMAPVSGGEYHWVSEFAPPKYQRSISYVTGWMSTLSWQAGNASGSFLAGTIIQALITVNYPDYVPQNWQGTLFVFAMVAVLFVVNVWGAQFWPKIQNGLLILHVLAFMFVLIVLCVLSPHQSAPAVFTDFENGGNWPNMGLSLMVGQINAIYTMLGADATAHMAEEVRDAGLYVPMSIVWSYVANGIIGVIFLIAYLFSIENVDDALSDPSGYPFIYVFRNCVSTAGVNALTIMVLVLVIASNISWSASTARQTFAFARDNGLPFSKWFAQVHPTLEIPANAIYFTCIFTILISLINIGSSIAFAAIMSLQVVAIMMTYVCSIGCILHRRIYNPELLPKTRWGLGRWGVIVNSVALGYSVNTFFWSFWPQSIPLTVENFNWSVVMFFAVLFLCAIMYVFQGRKVYVGPVTIIRAHRLD